MLYTQYIVLNLMYANVSVTFIVNQKKDLPWGNTRLTLFSLFPGCFVYHLILKIIYAYICLSVAVVTVLFWLGFFFDIEEAKIYVLILFQEGFFVFCWIAQQV